VSGLLQSQHLPPLAISNPLSSLQLANCKNIVSSDGSEKSETLVSSLFVARKSCSLPSFDLRVLVLFYLYFR
jgi:hypothetical protein